MAQQKEEKQYMKGKDMLWLPDGSVYHLGVKKGEIFNRILTVGSIERADAIAALFDKDKPLVHNKISPRLFKTVSGYYKGVGVSVVAIGMGVAMADFLIREASAVLEGEPMYIIRLGTCGIFNPDLQPGTLIVASKGCLYCGRNYSYFCDKEKDAYKKPYIVTDLCKPDKRLTKILVENLKKQNVSYYEGLNVSGETFFATQGRQNEDFFDDNKGLLEELKKHKIDSMEMETHTLLHLAKHRKAAPTYATGVHIGILNRVNPDITSNITEAQLEECIMKGATAVLDTLAEIDADKK